MAEPNSPAFSLQHLEAHLKKRAAAPADESYTASLVLAGMPLAARKLGEEAIECVVAALEPDRGGLTAEAADLLYHLLVVLQIADIPFAAVESELARRTGQSGLAEKAARPS